MSDPSTEFSIFITPQLSDRPPYLPDSSQLQYNLMRHFENHRRGVIVWQRSDGTYCVETPVNFESAMTEPAGFLTDDPVGPDLTADFPALSDSNVNYPWNPFPGSTNSPIPGQYVSITNWDQTKQDFILDPYLLAWWQGGSYNVITNEQALALTAAGFGDCIGPAPADTEMTTQPDALGPYGSEAINA